MSLSDLQALKVDQTPGVRRPQSNPSSTHKLKRHYRRQRPTEANLEESLSSALLASDRELSQIVREVDEISNTLKVKSPDARSLRVAQHPAVWSAVKEALLERELRHLGLTDELTCLYNQRGFFAAATQMLHLARRKKQSALLLFCDVDNLKLINNSLGQREGDLTLIRAAEVLEQTFRDADVIARIGGDEFVVLIMEASSQVQRILLGRLEECLRTSGAGNGPYTLSFSVGVACFDPRQAVSLGELMLRAEQAMNEKKHRKMEAGLCRPQIESDVAYETNFGFVTES
jgi:diguanylate cyclase (GGDEF)-like protein